MELLDGKVVKAKLLEDLKEKVDKLDTKLGLTVIQVGDDPASSVYVKQKNKMAESLGFNFNHIKLDENIKEDELLNIIDEMNNDNGIYKVKISDIILNSSSSDYITIKIDNINNTIEIDYTNLLRINDNNITKAIVTITYSNINKLNSLEE